MKSSHIPARTLGLLAFGFAVLGFFLLSSFGVTWDEALGDFFFGERYLSYFSSFDERYLQFDDDPYPSERQPDLSMSPFRNRPWEYYPVANTLAALTSHVLSRWLGILDPFDGFHAVNLWLGALLIWVFVRSVEREMSSAAAIAGVLFLFTSPRLVVHWLANTKDFPEMVFFSLTLLVFHRAWQKGSTLGLFLAAALSGLALGTKANAVFLPLVLLPYLVLARLPGGWIRPRRAVLALSAAAVLGPLAFFSTWPYLWEAPWERLAKQLDYVRGQVDQVRGESLLSPLAAIFGTTPLPFLLLAFAGMLLMLPRLRRREPFSILLVAWIVVVIGRLYLPGAVNFDGVRHFLELFPALAITAGLATSRLVALVLRHAPAFSADSRVWWLAPATVLGLIFGPGLWGTLSTHPNQIAYWNAFAGGIAGAHQRGLPQAGDYWALSYRQGLEYVNEHLPQDSILVVPIAQHSVNLVAQTRLRPDIGLAHVSLPTRPDLRPDAIPRLRQLGRDRPVYVMFVPRADWMNELMADCLTRLEPVHSWRLDGVPILLIYRYPDGSDTVSPSDAESSSGTVSSGGTVSSAATLSSSGPGSSSLGVALSERGAAS